MRAISVALVSMFYAGGARDINDRVRNLRVMTVSDMLGHVGALVLALAGMGFVGAVGMLAMSLTGLGAFVYALQEKPAEGGTGVPPRFTRYWQLTIPWLMGLGMASTVALGLGLVSTVVLAHVGLPLSASIAAPIIFGDADPAPAIQ